MIDFKITDQTPEHQLYEDVDYQKFWAGLQQQKLDELERILITRMVGLPAARLMDAGCGYGRLFPCYQQGVDEMVLLDSSHSLLKQAKENTFHRATYVSSDISRIPLQDATFDRILLIRVLHHLPDPAAIFRELSRLLIPGGHLIFTYCNKKNLERVFRWLLARNPYHPFKREPSTVWERFFMHHPDYIHEELNKAGFQIHDIRGAGVLDKIAGKLGKLGEGFPLGVGLAPFFGRSALAPWIFCDAVKLGDRVNLNPTPLMDLFQCPNCGNKLIRLTDGFACSHCGKVYQESDGILDFQ